MMSRLDCYDSFDTRNIRNTRNDANGVIPGVIFQPLRPYPNITFQQL